MGLDSLLDVPQMLISLNPLSAVWRYFWLFLSGLENIALEKNYDNHDGLQSPISTTILGISGDWSKILSGA